MTITYEKMIKRKNEASQCGGEVGRSMCKNFHATCCVPYDTGNKCNFQVKVEEPPREYIWYSFTRKHGGAYWKVRYWDKPESSFDPLKKWVSPLKAREKMDELFLDKRVSETTLDMGTQAVCISFYRKEEL
jgi:hypothetical protein